MGFVITLMGGNQNEDRASEWREGTRRIDDVLVHVRSETKTVVRLREWEDGGSDKYESLAFFRRWIQDRRCWL